MFRREKKPKSSRGRMSKREYELGGSTCQYPKREKMSKFQRGTMFLGDIMPNFPRGKGFKISNSDSKDGGPHSALYPVS